MSTVTKQDDMARAIRAIPGAVLGASLKTLLLAHVDHARSGESTSFASNGTLASEVGLSPRQVSRNNAKLVLGGWLVEDRRGESKHAGRDFAIGPTTREWVRATRCGTRGEAAPVPCFGDRETTRPGAIGHHAATIRASAETIADAIHDLAEAIREGGPRS
jgi:hypothetical protein